MLHPVESGMPAGRCERIGSGSIARLQPPRPLIRHRA